MLERSVQTSIALHARPLDRLVRQARCFSSSIRLRHGAKEADGKNVVQLLLLGAGRGAEICIIVDGEDEHEALTALLELLRGEEEAPEPTPTSGLSPAEPIPSPRVSRPPE